MHVMKDLPGLAPAHQFRRSFTAMGIMGYLIKKLFCVALIAVWLVPHANNNLVQTKYIQLPINSIPDNDRTSIIISSKKLPKPYDYLLTQPLMTKAIESYYGRTPIIEVISAQLNQKEHTYHRVITMLIDRNKIRNNPKEAQIKKEVLVVEFAFITMNFNTLPKKIINSILNTNIPFGQLLIDSHLKVLSKDRVYFTTRCNKNFALLFNCHFNDRLYGRLNTIIREDNKQWLAKVVEILPITSKSKNSRSTFINLGKS